MEAALNHPQIDPTFTDLFDLEYVGQDQQYMDVLAKQEATVQTVFDGGKEKIFMVEHHPVYTAGSSAADDEHLKINDIPVVSAGRGGRYTYHGPGQRVVYPILDLRNRGRDLRKYICDLQKWLINTLAEFGIEAYAADEIGVWVKTPKGEAKIAAIGVEPFIDELVASAEVGVTKPDARVFQAALSRLGGTPDQAVMIGDSWSSDILGATGMGIRAIWLNRYDRLCPDARLATEIRSLEPVDDVVDLILSAA